MTRAPKDGFVRVNGILQPPRDVMLRRRVLSLEEFAQERRRGKLSAAERTRLFGTPTAPIPVPLAPGETEDEYERRYRASVGESVIASFVDNPNPNRERVSRSSFAIQQVNLYISSSRKQKLEAPKQQEKPPKQQKQVATAEQQPARQKKQVAKAQQQPPTNQQQVPKPLQQLPKESETKVEGPQTTKGHSREVLNRSKVVGLEQFREYVEDGTLDKYRAMDAAECMAVFQAPIMPVFVALARGESRQQYEDRFVAWLKHKYDTTLEEIEKDPKLCRERNLRLYFATLNGKGFEKFVPPREMKRERDEEPKFEISAKKPKPTEEIPSKTTVMETCTGHATIDGCTTCRCRQCLLKGIGLLANKISELDATRVYHDCPCRSEPSKKPSPRIVDVSSDEETSPVKISFEEDAIEESLQRNYDEINEQIVMNEKALEASIARLVSEPVADIQESSRIQDENNEFRELILEEYGNRTTALAMLILYRSRHDLNSLTKAVTNTRAVDVPHIQRSSHWKCAELAALITEKQTQSDQTIGDEIRRLCTIRQREFVTLIHFDRHLREVLQSLLDRVRRSEAIIRTSSS